jgi:hypothetical protein
MRAIAATKENDLQVIEIEDGLQRVFAGLVDEEHKDEDVGKTRSRSRRLMFDDPA